MAFFDGSSLTQSMGNEDMTVYVGPEKKMYLVHKQLLVSESAYFKKALTGGFKEATQGAIYLEEETTDAFDLFVRWLYQRKIAALETPFVKTILRNGLEHKSRGFNRNSFPRARYRQSLGDRLNTAAIPFWCLDHSGMPGHPVDEEMADTTAVPKNPGTGTLRFAPAVISVSFTVGGPTTSVDQYLNISSQEGYRSWSPEEFRLADYEAGRTNPITPDSASPIPTQSEGTFKTATGRIDGIPKCQTISELVADDEKKQLALLQLCMMAETMCWDRLFNAAMTAYILTEGVLQRRRPYPASHIHLIYSRSHAASPSRRFAASAALSHIYNPSAQKAYSHPDLLRTYPDFIYDMFKALHAAEWFQDSFLEGQECAFHVHAEGECCFDENDRFIG